MASGIEIIDFNSAGGGGTVTAADNGLSLAATTVELGGALLHDTVITNGGFKLSVDEINPTLIDLAGQLIQVGAVQPTGGINANDILLLDSANIIASQDANNFTETSPFVGGSHIINITSTGALEFDFQFNGNDVLMLTPSFNALGSNSIVGPGAVNGDLWITTGGGIASSNAIAFGKIEPLITNNTRIRNASAVGKVQTFVSGGIDGSQVQASEYTSNGHLHLKQGGTFTDVAVSRLTVDSTSEGVLIPRMTTAQMNAITGVNGLLIYNTDVALFAFWKSTAWAFLISSATLTPTILLTGVTATLTAPTTWLTFIVPASTGQLQLNIVITIPTSPGVGSNASIAWVDRVGGGNNFTLNGPTVGNLETSITKIISVQPGSSILGTVTVGAGDNPTIQYSIVKLF